MRFCNRICAKDPVNAHANECSGANGLNGLNFHLRLSTSIFVYASREDLASLHL